MHLLKVTKLKKNIQNQYRIYLQVSTFELYNILKSYGPIYDIRRSTDDLTGQKYFRYVILFGRSEPIDAITNKKELAINGQIYPVKWAKWPCLWYDGNNLSPGAVANELKVVPDIDSPQHILSALNDDCLRSILLQDTVGIDELFNIARTCTRLKRLAIDVYSSKYRNNYGVKITNCWPLQKIECFFKIFGTLCDRLWIYHEPLIYVSTDPMWEIMAQHCTVLVDVKVSGAALPNSAKCKALFSKLKILRVNMSRKCSLRALFDEDSQLEVLQLCECSITIPRQQFPNLFEVIINRCDYRYDTYNSLIIFFQLNAQLLHLNLSLNQFDSSFQLPDVIQNLVNLKKLRWLWIHDYDKRMNASLLRNLDHFARLSSLRKLIIPNDASTREIITAVNPNIESISLISPVALSRSQSHNGYQHFSSW